MRPSQRSRWSQDPSSCSHDQNMSLRSCVETGWDLRLEHFLGKGDGSEVVEVGRFDAESLLVETVRAKIRLGRCEARVLGFEVLADGAGFIDDEVVVLLRMLHQRCNSAEWPEGKRTRYGICPKGWILRYSGCLCSPVKSETLTNSKGSFFSCRAVATRRVHGEEGKP